MRGGGGQKRGEETSVTRCVNVLNHFACLEKRDCLFIELSRSKQYCMRSTNVNPAVVPPLYGMATSAGMWNLLYTTTPGASGGKLGPFIGDVQQEVDIAEGLYVNYVRLGPLTGKLDATWDVINKQQWKVTGGNHGRRFNHGWRFNHF